MDLQKCFMQGAPVWVPLALSLTGRCGLQGRVPLTLPLATAVAGADALKQVPPIVLLAPGIPNSIGRPSVLIVAPVCVRKEAMKHVNQVELGKCSVQT